MTTNITSKFIQGTGVSVTTEGDTRILAIHAFCTVNGTFDIIQRGHLELLRYAKTRGYVYVGIDTDECIKG